MNDCPSSYSGSDRRAPTCQFSEDSAMKAVRDVFAILGVDVDRPEQVREFQESLRFGEFMRKTANKGVFALMTTMVSAMLLATWYGIKTLLER